MAFQSKLPTWVLWWFQVSIAIVCWDISFVLLRPLSMQGGPYVSFYQPYTKYVTIDKMYGHMLDDGTRDFIIAQSWMNIFESLLGVYAIVQHYRGGASCEVVAFTAATMTFAKTVLYALVELAAGGRNTLHNEWFDLVFLYYIPNYLWIVFPGAIMYTLGSRMVALYSSKEKHN
eukprot:m.24904 g.24904  ORF g.24904 m.24904 type:complete len:174 (+) comp36774_c0_seq1:274-795(+)